MIRVVFFMIRVYPSPILLHFYFFIRSELVRVDPSWSDPDWRSELIRSDFCTCLKESNHTQNILLDGIYLIYFFKSICKKTYGFILKLWQKRGQSLDESLRRGKLVKNFKIFWMNNKTIIEFTFRVLWRIMQISVDVILPRSALFFISYTASFNNCSIYYDKVCRDYWFLILCQIQSNCWIWPLWWSVE